MENTNSSKAKELSDLTKIKYLTPKEAIFSTTEGSLLALQLKDKFYNKVDLYQAFPYSLEEKYISVRDEQGEEIGIIKDLQEFGKESQVAIKTELKWRYYAPQINRILNIKDEFGHMYWDVETDHGFRKFVTRGRDTGIFPISESRILIVDMTGNRFEIPDYHQLDQKSMRFLEPLI